MTKAQIMEQAKRLENRLNTEWAMEHNEEWQKLAAEMEKAYQAGVITAEEHDEIAMTAFWDFQGEFKCEG